MSILSSLGEREVVIEVTGDEEVIQGGGIEIAQG